MIDPAEVQDALRSAVLGGRENAFDQASTLNPERHERQINRETAAFKAKLLRFLGDMPEDALALELIEMLEDGE